MLSDPSRHISVCICTFKRTPLLKRLLQALEEQETDGLFTFSIVVADNDQGKISRGPRSGVRSGRNHCCYVLRAAAAEHRVNAE